MREGWELKQLLEVCEYDKTKHNGEEFPYVGLEHIESHTGRFLGSLEATEVKSSTFRFSSSHLLYGRLRPYLNKVLLPDFDGHCSTEIFPIKLSDEILREYIFYWFIMDTTVSKIDATWTGARMPRANMKEVINFQIPIPPLPEQRQIVAILDQAFAAIDQAKANIQKNIQNAKELFQSKLNEIFSRPSTGSGGRHAEPVEAWEEKTLGEVCNGFQYGSSSKSIEQGEIPVLRMGNIQDGKIDWKKLKYSDNANENEKFILKNEDVLFNRTNSAELVGKAAIYEEERSAIFAGYIIRLRGKKGLLNNYFLNFYLNSTKAREYGFSVMSSSVNQANINASKLKDYKIVLPAYEKQSVLVEELKTSKINSEKLQVIYNTQLENLEELKKSILQKAFAGELTSATLRQAQDGSSASHQKEVAV